MTQTPQPFFEKYLRWFTLAFFILFLFKSVQSCNRNMGTKITMKKANYTIDSLSKKVDILERSLELCNEKSKMKDDFISSNKTQREKELEIRLKEAEKRTVINNNITLPKDTTIKK